MPGFWEGYRQNIVTSLRDVGEAEQLVAEHGGAIVGTVLLYPPRRMKISQSESLDMPWPEVRLLAVAPSARGRGVGGALMRECMRRVRPPRGGGFGLPPTHMVQTPMRMFERKGFVRAPPPPFPPAPGAAG